MTTKFFKDFVRMPFAWPGGYPLYMICMDGGAICRHCAKKEAKLIIAATRNPHTDPQWECAAVEVNWEDADLRCDHCDSKIESAYGED